ncbi:MAG: SPASM domain-containing protein [Bacteroidales bacterium]|jgi:radical SAM protein with 4Fe4S-binding SPASM domain|nr:SPASM domain-containing protein [Bacteroidales bacterium]
MRASQYLNASYSLFSYAGRRYTGIPLNPPLPPAINVELTSVCNLACPECLTGIALTNRKSGFIDFDLSGKIATELSGTTLSAWLYFQGEPMLHPRFFEIVSLFHRMNPVISTNGHFLDQNNCTMLAESGLKKIIISYDGATQETYSAYRAGGDHTRVTEGIQLLAETIESTRSSLKMELQFLVGSHNETEAGQVALFAKSVGASFRIKSMQVLDNKRIEEWIPAEKRNSRYMTKHGKHSSMHKVKRGCFRMWRGAVITTDGDVVPCCFDKNGKNIMGNLYHNSFSEIWNGPEYRKFRANVMKSRSHEEICKNCPQGSRLFFSK